MVKAIAIDGPSGAGKSTVAKIIAQRLDYKYIDTGAMYRSVTYLALEKGLDLDDSEEVITIAEDIKIDFSSPAEDGSVRVFVNGADLSQEIRQIEVDNNVSKVASIPEVREIMLKKQRKLAGENDVVMDGRDIGTRVLSDAELKIYVTASLEERARRRHLELQERGDGIELQDVKEQIAQRDKKDSTREHSPLRKAEDAHEINTTNMTPAEVADRAIDLWEGGE
ncbi:MAG: (d)CMP kinase [Bacillota bacterium]